ncbi:MAG: F0F1 ATP synthase subunit B' [Kiloniellales bacterium]
MPQFDFSTFPSQIFWLVITFVALYFALGRTAIPKIAEVLEARQRKIDDDLERATELELQAKEVLTAYEAGLAEARDRAQGVVRQTAEEMTAAAEAQHQELAAKLAAEVEAAEGRIEAAKTDALANIRQVASEVARAATQRLIGVEVDPGKADEAVAAVLKERS